MSAYLFFQYDVGDIVEHSVLGEGKNKILSLVYTDKRVRKYELGYLDDRGRVVDTVWVEACDIEYDGR